MQLYFKCHGLATPQRYLFLYFGVPCGCALTCGCFVTNILILYRRCSSEQHINFFIIAERIQLNPCHFLGQHRYCQGLCEHEWNSHHKGRAHHQIQGSSPCEKDCHQLFKPYRSDTSMCFVSHTITHTYIYSTIDAYSYRYKQPKTV